MDFVMKLLVPVFAKLVSRDQLAIYLVAEIVMKPKMEVTVIPLVVNVYVILVGLDQIVFKVLKRVITPALLMEVAVNLLDSVCAA
jgi:hypothetical protein